MGVLTLLNLRGARESVAVIAPIFLLFIVTHVAGLVTGIIVNAGQIPLEWNHLHEQSSVAVRDIGLFGLLLILFRAFTLGGGTYTGIEAVSNGFEVLREPKVETAKVTMRYMAISLALIAAGILFGYLLYQVRPVPGRTLNAVLFSAIASHVFPPGSHIGHAPRRDHADLLGRPPLRRRADRLPRRAARARLHGLRPLGALAVLEPLRASRHVERRALHGDLGH